MSNKAVQLQVGYGVGDENKECSGVLFEIPEVDVIGGQSLPITIWGHNLDAIREYSLFIGTRSLGGGSLFTEPAYNLTEVMNFAETSSFQAKYPIEKINYVKAISDIFYINSNEEIKNIAYSGEVITHHFERKGYSCVKEILNTNLYGGAEVNYTRSRHKKIWNWIVPTGKACTYWFFLYKNVLKNKFSIAIPDLTDGTMVKKDILLRIVEYGTDAPIHNAQIMIDEQVFGYTDTNGAIALRDIEQGTYKLKVKANGYIPSEDDMLYNDEFTVY